MMKNSFVNFVRASINRNAKKYIPHIDLLDIKNYDSNMCTEFYLSFSEDEKLKHLIKFRKFEVYF